MDRDDLDRATKANSDLKTAEHHLEALLTGGFKVVGIVLDRDEGLGLGGSITLQRGCGVGSTGSISGIGYSAELQSAMTKALHDHFRSKIDEAKALLESLGIKIAA
jgi:hypothetical protein